MKRSKLDNYIITVISLGVIFQITLMIYHFRLGHYYFGMFYIVTMIISIKYLIWVLKNE